MTHYFFIFFSKVGLVHSWSFWVVSDTDTMIAFVVKSYMKFKKNLVIERLDRVYSDRALWNWNMINIELVCSSQNVWIKLPRVKWNPKSNSNRSLMSVSITHKSNTKGSRQMKWETRTGITPSTEIRPRRRCKHWPVSSHSRFILVNLGFCAWHITTAVITIDCITRNMFTMQFLT